MYKSNKSAITGVVIFLSFFILIYSVFFFSSVRYKITAYKLIVNFDNAFGLTEGSPVMIKGIKIGVVKSIYLEDNKVKVVLRINKRYKITKDAQIVVMDNSFMGDKKIEIAQGTAKEYYKNNDVVDGKYASGMEELKKIVESIGSVAPKVTSNNTIEGLMGNVWAISEGLKVMVDKQDQLFDAVHRLDILIKSTQEWGNDNVDKISALIPKMDTALIYLNSSSHELDKSAKELNKMLTAINSGKGTLGKLIYDDSLYINISNVIKNADSLIIDIRKSPEKYGKLNIKLF